MAEGAIPSPSLLEATLPIAYYKGKKSRDSQGDENLKHNLIVISQAPLPLTRVVPCPARAF